MALPEASTLQGFIRNFRVGDDRVGSAGGRMAQNCSAAALAAMLWLLLGLEKPAVAAGALAVGSCGAWGGAWSYRSYEGAKRRALRECKSTDCRIVARVTKQCASFAYDDSVECGPWGWAARAQQTEADESALDQCAAGGGAECAVRGRLCDR